MLLKTVNITPRIKFKEILHVLPHEKVYQSSYEVVFKIKDESYIILYSFGAISFFNVEKLDADYFIEKLSSYVPFAEEKEIFDDYQILIDKKSKIIIEHDRAILPAFKLDYLRIISLVLAESVALESLELKTEDMLHKASKYSAVLQSKGTLPTNQKDLLKYVGFALNVRQEILNNLYISDAPDETWDNVELEKLFREIKDMFDIEPRFRSLNIVLNSIQESTQTMVGLLDARKNNYLETLIIILILVEIVISLIEFFR